MKILCIVINLIGGALVLGSYAYGLAQNNPSLSTLWGGVPASMRPFYTLGMILAALGYLSCSFYLLFLINASEARVYNIFSYNIFNFIYIIILTPSILFIFLASKMILAPSMLTWFTLRFILFLVALGAFLMIIALVGLTPRSSHWGYGLALIGSALFFLHTFILDAIIWPYFFKK
jgi:hypothetical protein